MKAQPLKRVDGAWEECSADEATDLMIRVPGPFLTRIIPVMRSGTRQGTPNWTWNGSMESPTLKPSILTSGVEESTGKPYCCHSFVNDGRIQFLGDCTHEFAGKTMDLLDI